MRHRLRQCGSSGFGRAALRWVAIFVFAAAGCVAGWSQWRHRPESAQRLAYLRAHAPPGMVLIPAGWFWMGSNDELADPVSRPMHKEWLPSFYVDRFPVTRSAYAAWDPHYQYPKGQGTFAATNQDWAKAAAYLKAQGKVLPTEAEWEKAARGVDGRKYPWGNRPGRWLSPRGSCRVLLPVDRYPQPASPFGVRDMAGSVWNWVRDNLDGDPKVHIIRGGASGYGAGSDTTYARGIEGTGVT